MKSLILFHLSFGDLRTIAKVGLQPTSGALRLFTTPQMAISCTGAEHGYLVLAVRVVNLNQAHLGPTQKLSAAKLSRWQGYAWSLSLREHHECVYHQPIPAGLLKLVAKGTAPIQLLTWKDMAPIIALPRRKHWGTYIPGLC